MLFLYVLFAACIGAWIGKFIAFTTYYLPLILLEEDKERDPRDIFKWFFQKPICLNCRHSMSGWHNTPILSYLLLQGKCPNCQSSLSFQNFLIELGISLLFAITVLFFSFNLTVLFVLVVSCLLICCFITDLEHGILPDQFTMTLLWVGLLGSLYSIFIQSQEAIIGAAIGYGFLWLNNEIYRYFRHQDGIFPGDFKLNAAIGACVGFKYFLIILSISMLTMLIISFLQFIYSNKMFLSGYLSKEISYGCYASIVTLFTIYLILSGWISDPHTSSALHLLSS